MYTAEDSSKQFLDYLEVPSVGLPEGLTEAQRSALQTATDSDSLAFPMLPYGNVDSHSLADIRQLEITLVK